LAPCGLPRIRGAGYLPSAISASLRFVPFDSGRGYVMSWDAVRFWIVGERAPRRVASIWLTEPKFRLLSYFGGNMSYFGDFARGNIRSGRENGRNWSDARDDGEHRFCAQRASGRMPLLRGWFTRRSIYGTRAGGGGGGVR